jgi:hypothetical protein
MLLSGLGSFLMGCTDGVADGTYAGEPLMTLSGLVRYTNTNEIPEVPLLATILWQPPSDEDYYEPPLRVETVFPARYSLSIYEPPPVGCNRLAGSLCR